MIPDDPLMTVIVEDVQAGVSGCVVIHNLGGVGGSGGVRALPDVSVEEVKELARAMAYKYAFFRLRPGGAKAAVKMDYDTPPEERRRIVEAFGRHIGLLLESKAYLPWTDMNFNGGDLQALFAGAGLHCEVTKTRSSLRTALSTFGALWATAEHLRLPPAECTVVLEGFGNVGEMLAELIDSWGGKVVGLSNTVGAVINEAGLNVKKLIKLKQEHGQACVTHAGPWESVERRELFKVPAAIVVPGARVHSIGADLARSLDTRALVPAANVPCTREAEAIVAQRGILLLPDFVVNGGGVLGVIASEGDEQEFFETRFKDLVGRLLVKAAQTDTPPIDVARTVADANYAAMGDPFRLYPSRRDRIDGLVRRLSLGRNGGKRAAEVRRENLRELLANYFTGVPSHANRT